MIVWPTATNGLAIQCKTVTVYLSSGEADVLLRSLTERQKEMEKNGPPKAEEPKVREIKDGGEAILSLIEELRYEPRSDLPLDCLFLHGRIFDVGSQGEAIQDRH